MCAMMPMFRVLLSATCRGISVTRSWLTHSLTNSQTHQLPPIVSEGLVGFRHPVCVFALLDRAAAQVRRVEQLVRQLLLHRLAVAARAGVADDPPEAERQPAVRVHFDGHLVVRAADAP